MEQAVIFIAIPRQSTQTQPFAWVVERVSIRFVDGSRVRVRSQTAKIVHVSFSFKFSVFSHTPMLTHFFTTKLSTKLLNKTTSSLKILNLLKFSRGNSRQRLLYGWEWRNPRSSSCWSCEWRLPNRHHYFGRSLWSVFIVDCVNYCCVLYAET